jgi:hypothetical protein
MPERPLLGGQGRRSEERAANPFCGRWRCREDPVCKTATARKSPAEAGLFDKRWSGLQRRPVSLRAMTRRWISLVPS